MWEEEDGLRNERIRNVCHVMMAFDARSSLVARGPQWINEMIKWQVGLT